MSSKSDLKMLACIIDVMCHIWLDIFFCIILYGFTYVSHCLGGGLFIATFGTNPALFRFGLLATAFVAIPALGSVLRIARCVLIGEDQSLRLQAVEHILPSCGATADAAAIPIPRPITSPITLFLPPPEIARSMLPMPSAYAFCTSACKTSRWL